MLCCFSRLPGRALISTRGSPGACSKRLSCKATLTKAVKRVESGRGRRCKTLPKGSSKDWVTGPTLHDLASSSSRPCLAHVRRRFFDTLYRSTLPQHLRNVRETRLRSSGQGPRGNQNLLQLHQVNGCHHAPTRPVVANPVGPVGSWVACRSFSCCPTKLTKHHVLTAVSQS